MKKALATMVALLMVLGMALSGSAAAETETALDTVLVNCQMTYSETNGDLLANGGENFVVGEGRATLQAAGEGLVLTSGDSDCPMIYLEKRLDDIGKEINGNQAFHIKFKADQSNFELMMSADNNAGLSIGQDNEAQIYLSSGEYRATLEGDARFEPDQWYHALLAMDTQGVLQAAFWKDGEEGNMASLNMPTGERFGENAYRNQSWEMSVGLRENATFTVDSYEYYTFDGYTEPGEEREDLEALVFDLVIASTLENAQTLWYEGSGGFAENQGGEFGGGAAVKQYNEAEGRLELFSDDIDACVPFNTTLRGCGPDNRQQQAILVRFQPENVSGFRFSFEGTDEMMIEFRRGGPYLYDMGRVTNMAFSDFAPNNFSIKPSSLYYLLFAADDHAMMRVFVWEEGHIRENQAYLEYDLDYGNDQIYDCDWKMFVGFGANGQFNIYEYWVYTFDRFLDDSPFIVTAEQ